MIKEYILLCVEYNITQCDNGNSTTYKVDTKLLVPVELKAQLLENQDDLWKFLATPTHEVYYSDSEEVIPYIVSDVVYGVVYRTHEIGSTDSLFHNRMRELELAY